MATPRWCTPGMRRPICATASDDRRASGPARQTPARDDKQTRRSSLLRLDSVRAVARAAGHVARVLMRAITHVEGKAIRSSRRARRGAGCWLRRTIGASERTPMSSSRMTWRRASAARRPLIGSACPDGRRGGGGVRSATLRTITRGSTAAAGVRPAVAVVGTRTGGALACRPERVSARASGDAGLSKEQLRSGPRRVPASAQIVQPGTPPDAWPRWSSCPAAALI